MVCGWCGCGALEPLLLFPGLKLLGVHSGTSNRILACDGSRSPAATRASDYTPRRHVSAQLHVQLQALSFIIDLILVLRSQ